jgi:ketosteroid isomerase-like protein
MIDRGRSNMSDMDEIRALVLSYARLLDMGDVDAVADLFEHSTWRSWPNGSVLRGTAEVRPVYENLVDQVGAHPTKHLITNLSIDVEPGASTASSHCYWTVLQSASAGCIAITFSGQYADSFEKVNDSWRFSDRLVSVDLTGGPSSPVK